MSIDRLRAILDANGVARMNERSFDIVVIGAGVAGREAAGRLADAGLSVAIVEADSSAASAPSGHACLPRRCCVPARRSLRPDASRELPKPRTASLDVEAVLARRDDVIHPSKTPHISPGSRAAASSSCDSKGAWTAIAVCAPGTMSSLRARP